MFSQFDYLKSIEIEEKINEIRRCVTSNGSLYVLSTNDKTVKLCKVQFSCKSVLSDVLLPIEFQS